MSAVGEDADLERPVALVRALQRDLRQRAGFELGDVEHAEQPPVEIALGRLHLRVALRDLRIVDEARRALEAGDRHLALGLARRIVIEAVERDADAARIADQRLDAVLIDQSQRLLLRERRIAFRITEEISNLILLPARASASFICLPASSMAAR